MYIQCPRCRTLNESDNTLLTDTGNELQCHHCKSIINIPPALSAIFSNSLSSVSAIPAPDNIAPQYILNTYASYQEFQEDNQSYPNHSSFFNGWLAAILVLLATFIVQYSYFMRDHLARHDILRPWLEHLCVLASCEIPLRKDIPKIIIINRDIRSDPDIKNILQVNITLKNIAPHIQPFPKMQLGFYDINGSRIAYRRFNPNEYLSKQTDTNKGMAPQVPVIANLKILDPGEHAITFEFEFF